MAELDPNRYNSSIVQIIAAAYEEWFSAQGRAPAVSINDAELEELATVIAYKLKDAGLIDDDQQSDAHRI